MIRAVKLIIWTKLYFVLFFSVTYVFVNDTAKSPIDSDDDDKTSWTPEPKIPKFATRAPNFLDKTDPVVWKSAIGVGLTVVFVMILLIILACWRLQRKRKKHVMRKTSFKKWNEELSVIKLPVPMMKSKNVVYSFIGRVFPVVNLTQRTDDYIIFHTGGGETRGTESILPIPRNIFFPLTNIQT